MIPEIIKIHYIIILIFKLSKGHKEVVLVKKGTCPRLGYRNEVLTNRLKTDPIDTFCLIIL